MIRGFLRCLFCLCVMGMMGGGLSAKPVTVQFKGVVSPTSFTMPREMVNYVVPGAPVFGRFRYDTDTKDSDRSPTRGLYVYRDPAYRLEVQLGRLSVATHPEHPEMRIQVLNNRFLEMAPQGIDRFDVMSRMQTALLPTAIVPGQLHVMLSDPSKRVFDSVNLPETLPNLNAFARAEQPYAQGQVATVTGQSPQVLIYFSVTHWEIVPEADEKEEIRLRPDEVILWSEPVDGLAMGIAPVVKPVMYIPARKDDGGGEVAGRRVKGRWHKQAKVQVLLKNVSDEPLSWSRDLRLWDVVCTKTEPNDVTRSAVASLQPQGRWYRLAPGRHGAMSLAFHYVKDWGGEVTPGEYTVRVRYCAERYKTRKATRQGPEGASRFWHDCLMSQPVTFEVVFPKHLD